MWFTRVSINNPVFATMLRPPAEVPLVMIVCPAAEDWLHDHRDRLVAALRVDVSGEGASMIPPL